MGCVESSEAGSKAGRQGDVLGLRQWLHSGGEPNCQGRLGGSLLHHAARHGKLACMEVLLDAGAELEGDSAQGTPLHVALWEYQLAATFLLVQRGANCLARHRGKTAAELAVELGFGHIDHAGAPEPCQALQPASAPPASNGAQGPGSGQHPMHQQQHSSKAPAHLPAASQRVAAPAATATAYGLPLPRSPDVAHEQPAPVEVGSASSARSIVASVPSSSISTDPLLLWVASQACGQAHGPGGGAQSTAGSMDLAPQAGAGPGDGAAGDASHEKPAGVGGGQALVDVHPWQLDFRELTFLRPLGEGSYGKVYLATYLETRVAVKVLMSLDGTQQQAEASDRMSQALSLSSPVLASLQKEAGLMAALRHPNCCALLGVCAFPPALVTELCERGSVADVLFAARQSQERAAELTVARRLKMALDASLGLHYLHCRGMVHRDVKSPNFLVTNEWTTKVADFNLSKIVEENNPRLSSMAAMNPRWLAPEILRGEPSSPASDVFSLGVVLWELLTWRIPWDDCPSPWLLVGQLMQGAQLAMPPRHELPGPGTAAWAGLDAYISLTQACCAQEAAERPPLEAAIARLRLLLEQAGGAVGD